MTKNLNASNTQQHKSSSYDIHYRFFIAPNGEATDQHKIGQKTR